MTSLLCFRPKAKINSPLSKISNFLFPILIESSFFIFPRITPPSQKHPKIFGKSLENTDVEQIQKKKEIRQNIFILFF